MFGSRMKSWWIARRAQVAVVAFSAIYGGWFLTPLNVWPLSTDWLLQGDMEFAQYMWQYFRNTPWLQWPITAVEPLGEGWGTIYPSSSGIALVGLPLKYLSFLLPTQFQFLGIWTLMCFVMQGWFAERLFARFGLDEAERVLGACSILIAPIFVFRIGMTHLDLSAQWVVLAGLLLYFSDSGHHQLRRWLLLIAVSMLIQIYLFVLTISIGLTWVVKRHMADVNQKSASNSLFAAGLMTFTGFLTWWILGFSTFLGQAQGVGFFRLNLLAFFNPESGATFSFSRLLSQLPLIRDRAFFAEESEGFGFIGLVGVIGIIGILASRRYWLAQIRKRNNLPIILTAGLLMIVAVSHRVAVVRREFEVPIPSALVDARQVFRVGNRFSWLAYYLALVVGWVALVYLARRLKFGAVVLGFIVVLGVLDQWNGIVAVRSSIIEIPARTGNFDSPDWERIGKSVSRMYIVPTFDVQDDSLPASAEVWLRDARWRRIAEFSARHQLVTNFTYVARPVGLQVQRSNDEIRAQISERRVPANTLLLFADRNEWLNAKKLLSGISTVKQLDDLFVIVTGDYPS